MQRGILTLVIVASLVGCSSGSSQKTASDLTSTTTEQVTSSTASSALTARALAAAIKEWKKSCDLGQCARSTPEGLAQALAARARAFGRFVSGDMLARVSELAAAAERVAQLGGCVYSVDPNCWLALQAVTLARQRFEGAVAAQ